MTESETGESDNGFIFRRQHLCRGGKRWFRDVWIIGEIVNRWLLCESPTVPPTFKCASGFELSKRDVERGSCQTVIGSIIASRPAEERGRHPGEDAQGRPTSKP